MNMKQKLAAGLAVVGSTLGAAAHADVPAGVTSAISSIGTDGSSVATTILIAVVAVFAIKFIRKGL